MQHPDWSPQGDAVIGILNKRNPNDDHGEQGENRVDSKNEEKEVKANYAHNKPCELRCSINVHYYVCKSSTFLMYCTYVLLEAKQIHPFNVFYCYIKLLLIRLNRLFCTEN